MNDILTWWDDPACDKAPAKKLVVSPPPIPQTGWKAPNILPDLSNARAISLDTETYDPDLLDYGPGWGRGKGHIVGVSIGAIDHQNRIGTWYFPVRHETQPQDNMNPRAVFSWLESVLNTPHITKIGANLQYDIGWLRTENVNVTGPLIDVQYMEALMHEQGTVSLEHLGQKYLNEGKESSLLYEWLSKWKGGKPDGSQRKWIYEAPPSLVGPYAQSDADLPIRLCLKMYPLIKKLGLETVLKMECKLIPLMVDMRFEGVSVDVQKAERLADDLKNRSIMMLDDIRRMVGFEVNVNSSQSLAKLFNHLGLKYDVTANGSPSFTKAFLASVDHKAAELVREIRKCDKLRGTFLESYILNSHVNGKVYGSFHQLRSDAAGTRSGRFSSSNPNLQNIPSRDDELAPLIRGLFIPDKEHAAWRKYDYSQIEYRMLIHFAVGKAGDDIRTYFNANPDTDYHDYTQDLVKRERGITIPRKPIKNINFGLIYGMGVPTLAESLKMSIDEAQHLMDAYFKGVPFAKPTMEAAMATAQQTGVITTIMGRRSVFETWEPADPKDKRPPLPYEQAIRQYGSAIQRSHTYKALNRLLQGSAADLMKAAMLKCYEDGVFDDIGVPRLTVHDELDFSDPGGKSEGFKEMKHIMETALPLNVPIKADGEIGPDWGHVEDLKE